jgi:hypothetical protein
LRSISISSVRKQELFEGFGKRLGGISG